MPFYTLEASRRVNNLKSLTVAKRLIKQIFGDKRTIALMLVVPVFVLYLLSIILDSAPTRANYGANNMTLFESLSPMLMGFFIFFFVFLIAGVSFLRERISGTLERILSTPLKRSEIVFGYFLGFGLFVVLQTIIIQVFTFYVLDIPIKGNFFTVLLVNLVLAAGSLSLGTFLSSFAKNEFQLFQFIPVIIVPQIMFCGIFDLTEAPIWVRFLSKVFPMTYGAEALKDVIIKGSTLSQVSINIFILLAYAVLFLMLNILALKKYRNI